MKKIFLLPFVCLVFACSSNNDPDDLLTQNVTTPFLKSRTYINQSSNFAGNETFTVENGYLISSTGAGLYSGEYVYDTDDKVISRTLHNLEFEYEYDAQGRVIKEVLTGVDDNYLELIYNDNNTITTRQVNGNNSITPVLETILTVDSQGRIIKMEIQNPQIPLRWQTYEYDANGNLVTVVSKTTNSPENTVHYTYTNLKNPYYDLLKKFYVSMFYVKNYAGFPGPIWDISGVSPNVRETPNIFEANADGYPKTEESGLGLIVYQYE